MKKLLFLCLVVIAAQTALSQAYSDLYKGSWNSTKHYGSAVAFAGDSVWVFNGTGKWVTLSMSYDTTAGTAIAYVCINNDSTKAIPLMPPVGGGYGEAKQRRVKGLQYLRVYPDVPVTLGVE